jgi:hypothetical protein
MAKQPIGGSYAVKALASLCADYNGAVERARQSGRSEVLVPAELSHAESLLRAFEDPRGSTRLVSLGDNQPGEPCYTSVNEFLEGRNGDGTKHTAYIVIDFKNNLITDLRDRNGESLVGSSSSNSVATAGFNNGSSHCMFIGNRRLEEVIAQDTRELAQIGGSFGAIADRMQEFVDFIERQNQGGSGVPYEEWQKSIGPVIAKYQSKYGSDWNKNSGAWKAYGEEWARLRAEFPQTHLDAKVAVLQGLKTRGFQPCPFGCRETWNDDIAIFGRKTGRKLTVNRGTVHLARNHHLLEKDNEYGVSAREFYESFMPDRKTEKV